MRTWHSGDQITTAETQEHCDASGFMLASTSWADVLAQRGCCGALAGRFSGPARPHWPLRDTPAARFAPFFKQLAAFVLRGSVVKFLFSVYVALTKIPDGGSPSFFISPFLVVQHMWLLRTFP